MSSEELKAIVDTTSKAFRGQKRIQKSTKVISPQRANYGHKSAFWSFKTVFEH
jgi:hypothetical protein